VHFSPICSTLNEGTYRGGDFRLNLKYGSRGYIKVNGYLMSFSTNVLNDYMKHIVETKLQTNGQNSLKKISEVLTYFHISP